MQEVDGEAALSRVVDPDVYAVHVDDRPRGSLNSQQNTGFAYKKGLSVTPQADVQTLDVDGDGRLRYGARINLAMHGQTVQLMSVHLKSGCFQNDATSSDCPALAPADSGPGELDRHGGCECRAFYRVGGL